VEERLFKFAFIRLTGRPRELILPTAGLLVRFDRCKERKIHESLCAEFDKDWIHTWIGSDWWNDCDVVLISNICSTVHAVSFKLRFMNFQLSRFYQD